MVSPLRGDGFLVTATGMTVFLVGEKPLVFLNFRKSEIHDVFSPFLFMDSVQIHATMYITC